jgi:hypothetical protein
VSVYVWRGRSGSSHRDFFSPYDQWDSAMARNRRRQFNIDSLNGRLSLFMQVRWLC